MERLSQEEKEMFEHFIPQQNIREGGRGGAERGRGYLGRNDEGRANQDRGRGYNS